jgi:GT2 family glycosyltransferase
MHPRLSIIVPTHKRADILRECLHALARQTASAETEVIVVSDGPDAKTAALFEKQNWPMPVRYKTIAKSQQGCARNAGVAMAETDVVLFIGDDTFLEEHACERHIAAHKNHPSTAVLGFTTWDPACGITPVMHWLEKSGWQFGYPMIADYAHDFVPVEIQHRFTYTSHISMPKNIAACFPFREDVRLYGWEDIEWGTRLATAGVRLFYEPGARALHHHHLTMEGSLVRMHTLGKSVVHLKKIAPELDRVPTGFKLLKYRIAALLPTMDGKHRKAFLEGMAAK